MLKACSIPKVTDFVQLLVCSRGRKYALCMIKYKRTPTETKHEVRCTNCASIGVTAAHAFWVLDWVLSFEYPVNFWALVATLHQIPPPPAAPLGGSKRKALHTIS